MRQSWVGSDPGWAAEQSTLYCTFHLNPSSTVSSPKGKPGEVSGSLAPLPTTASMNKPPLPALFYLSVSVSWFTEDRWANQARKQDE